MDKLILEVWASTPSGGDPCFRTSIFLFRYSSSVFLQMAKREDDSFSDSTLSHDHGDHRNEGRLASTHTLPLLVVQSSLWHHLWEKQPAYPQAHFSMHFSSYSKAYSQKGH